MTIDITEREKELILITLKHHREMMGMAQSSTAVDVAYDAVNRLVHKLEIAK
jgi:hypothetical protein